MKYETPTIVSEAITKVTEAVKASTWDGPTRQIERNRMTAKIWESYKQNNGISQEDMRKVVEEEIIWTAAYRGGLDTILGGVTAPQLAALKKTSNGIEGWSALHQAAYHGHLAEIKGGVTAEQLLATVTPTGEDALGAAIVGMHGKLNGIKGDVTVEQLLKSTDPKGGRTIVYMDICHQSEITKVKGWTLPYLLSEKNEYATSFPVKMVRDIWASATDEERATAQANLKNFDIPTQYAQVMADPAARAGWAYQVPPLTEADLKGHAPVDFGALIMAGEATHPIYPIARQALPDGSTLTLSTLMPTNSEGVDIGAIAYAPERFLVWEKEGKEIAWAIYDSWSFSGLILKSLQVNEPNPHAAQELMGFITKFEPHALYIAGYGTRPELEGILPPQICEKLPMVSEIPIEDQDAFEYPPNPHDPYYFKVSTAQLVEFLASDKTLAPAPEL